MTQHDKICCKCGKPATHEGNIGWVVYELDENGDQIEETERAWSSVKCQDWDALCDDCINGYINS